jgi:hypothetical protein
MKRDIFAGLTPCSEQELLRLVALQCQYDLGDLDANKPVAVSTLIPPGLITETKPAAYWSELIKGAYFPLLYTSKPDCVAQFVKLCKTLQFYGCFLVDIQIVSD